MASSLMAKSNGTFNYFRFRIQDFSQIASVSITPRCGEFYPSPLNFTSIAQLRLLVFQSSEPIFLQALLKMGIRGVTVSDVRGFGAQGGLSERQAGSEFSEDKFVAKVKMEIVVSKDRVEAVIEKIIEEARTGEIGDGKIFLVPVSDVIRVRTGECGEMAERMIGERTEMSSPASST